MEKEVGIVLDRYENNRIEGHFAVSKVWLDIDEEGRPRINNEIEKVMFSTYTKVIKNIRYVECYVDSGTQEDAIKIGKALKQLGFFFITVVFNNKKIPIE